jgi:hypothetical protein
MKINIIEISGGNKRIGLLTCNGANGPEKGLLDSFVKSIPQCFRWQRDAVGVFH